MQGRKGLAVSLAAVSLAAMGGHMERNAENLIAGHADPALKNVRVARVMRGSRPRVRTRTVEHPEEIGTVTLKLTATEAAALKAILREAVTNDLDLLEDLAYANDLVTPACHAACERVSLAVRLDVALEA